MNVQNVLRYDAVSDVYQHLEHGAPGRYHGKTAAQAALERLISRATRLKKQAEERKSPNSWVTGRVK